VLLLSPFLLFFFFFFFILYSLNFVCQAKKLTRYKRPVHPTVWSQTTSGNSPSLLPPAKSPLSLPDTVGSNELSGAMCRKLEQKIQAGIHPTKNLRRRAAHKKKPQPESEQPSKSKETSILSRKEHQKAKNHRQPTLSPTVDPILTNQGRDQGASRTKLCPQQHAQWGKGSIGTRPSRRGKRTAEGDPNPNQHIGSVWQHRVKTVGPPETGPGAVHIPRGTEAAA